MDETIILDARTGKYLWRFQTGGNMAASPMSYAVDGKQHVAVSGGTSIYSFALPPSQSPRAPQRPRVRRRNQPRLKSGCVNW